MAALTKHWVNIYFNREVGREFEGNRHPTKEIATAAANDEMRLEPKTRLVRQEERDDSQES